jgi:aminopeptidase
MTEDDFKIMVEQAERALKIVVEAKKNDKVHVITDEESMEIGEAFKEASKRLGLSASLFKLPKERPIKEMPEELKNNLDSPEIYVNAFQSSAEETPFRIDLIMTELEKGAKVAHAPGITKDMFIRGALRVDYSEMMKRAEALFDIMENAEYVRIRTEKGTDLLLKISGRKFQTDIKIRSGEIGNLPAGEIWCAPHEDGANGIAVIDGTIGDLGFVPCPVRLHIKDGKVTDIECENEDFKKRLEEVLSVDEMASVIGELGIGLNDGAKLIGNMLVDEKAAKTIHIAFGNNIDFYGGKNNSSVHRDFLIKEPDMEVLYPDGTRKQVMRKGELIL